MSTMMRSAAVLVSGLIAGGVLVGCSPAVTGGDTTCKDYTAADEKTQTDAVTKWLKDEKGTDPSGIEITAGKLSASTFCSTTGKPDSKIKEAPHI